MGVAKVRGCDGGGQSSLNALAARYVMERSRFLNARAAENYVKPPEPDLHLIEGAIGKAPYNTN